MRLTPIPLAQLRPVPGERKQIRATVASPRLDAVAAAGFSIPRSRAAELIRGGRVMVEPPALRQSRQGLWRQGMCPACRGLGKCVLREIGGTSKRGRTILELERYL
ncbi:MAG: S4 domain-containing protein [Evtepia gabavorous]